MLDKVLFRNERSPKKVKRLIFIFGAANLEYGGSKFDITKKKKKATKLMIKKLVNHSWLVWLLAAHDGLDPLNPISKMEPQSIPN